MFFDTDQIRSNEVRFYLHNPSTNKGFAFDVAREDKFELERILKKNGIPVDVDDGGEDLPF
jgi:hypothetical protein